MVETPKSKKSKLEKWIFSAVYNDQTPAEEAVTPNDSLVRQSHPKNGRNNQTKGFTLPKFNMEPENDGFQ